MMYVYTKNLSTVLDKYVIFGERHSGTKFLQKLISARFDLKLNTEYSHKHFFGFDDPHKILKDHNTLFLGITRNPYEWLAAFNTLSHHVPNHLKPILEHLEDEWYSIDQYYHLHDKRAYRYNKRSKEILDDRSMIHGERYSNIFELRISKMNYLINTLPNLANNYILISYESLTKNIDLYISIIENKLCVPKTKNQHLVVLEPKSRLIDQDIKNLISVSLNWHIENQMGYNRDVYF